MPYRKPDCKPNDKSSHNLSHQVSSHAILHGFSYQQLNRWCLSLKHRPVRDLAWALLRPSLLTQLPCSTVPQKSDDLLPCDSTEWLQAEWIDAHTMNWLQALDQQPESLLAHLKDQRATRLGIYFEQLLSFYFGEYPTLRLIAKNLQVNNKERTLGEYDFLVKNRQTQQCYHIEVAVKFYLGMQTDAAYINKNTPIYNWHSWVGPNKRDTLGIKAKHLSQHQLTLSQTEAGKAALATIDVNSDTLRTRLLMTSCLYYPYQQDAQKPNVEAPRYSNEIYKFNETLQNENTSKQTIFNTTFNQKIQEDKLSIDTSTQGLHSLMPSSSYWLTVSELMQSPTFLNASNTSGKNWEYIILARQQWMSPLTNVDEQQLGLERLSLNQLLEHIRLQADREWHISQIYPRPEAETGAETTLQSPEQHCYIEHQRFFVIPDE